MNMDDVLTSKLIEKYGKDFGHVFNDNGWCTNCGIQLEEFNRKKANVGKKTTKFILCDKIVNELELRKKDSKKKIQNMSKKEFWKLLLEFHDKNRYEGKLKWVHSFKETFEWFYKTYKINRSTIIKNFSEIYCEQRWGGTNSIRVHGAPTGSYKEKDRMPIDRNGVHREWSLWGIDDFNLIDRRYETDSMGVVQ